MSTDAIILAAGKGARLAGLAAKYHKPLLVVNGKPLVRNAIQVAAPHVNRIFLVVAPANANPICDVIEGLDVTVVVQRHADGPGSALLLAAELSKADNVLVLMADNVLSEKDIDQVIRTGAGSAGIRKLGVHEAARFTWFNPDTQGWVEMQTPQFGEDEEVMCWVGPLMLERERAVSYLQFEKDASHEPGTELLIGPHLNDMGVEAVVHVSTYDIGALDQWA